MEYIDGHIPFYSVTFDQYDEIQNVNKKIEAKIRNRDTGINVSDFMMIRTTNGMPRYGFVESADKYIEPLKMLSPLGISHYDVSILRYRDTVHWSLNNTASDHANGTFSGRNFIILEPLNEHIDDSNLVNLKECDIYFKGDVQLSSKTIILVPLNYYEANKDKPEFKDLLDNYDVRVFEGNEELVVASVLQENGYYYAKMSEWGYFPDDGITLEGLFRNYLIDLSKEKGLRYVDHYFTKTETPESEHYRSLASANHSREIFWHTMSNYISSHDELFSKVKELSFPRIDYPVYDYYDLDSVGEYDDTWLDNLDDNFLMELYSCIRSKDNPFLFFDRDEYISRIKNYGLQEVLTIYFTQLNDFFRRENESHSDPTNPSNYDGKGIVLEINHEYYCISKKILFQILGHDHLLKVTELTNQIIDAEYREERRLKDEELLRRLNENKDVKS